MHTYKDLIVWQKSVKLVLEVYKLTSYFPKEELYGMASQVKRAAISIPSNIAEGRKRGTDLQYLRFLEIALGSCAELETQLIIVKELHFTNHKNIVIAEELLREVNLMLHKMTLTLYQTLKDTTLVK